MDQHDLSVQQPPQSDVPDQGLQNIALSADLDFELIWPDTEDLFHTIMSSDTSWQMPLATLPFPPGMTGTGAAQPDSVATYDTPSSFDDRASSVGSIPTGGSHQAVHDVSQMVTSLVSDKHFRTLREGRLTTEM